MKLLLYLVAHQKELVKKEKLIDTIWSDVIVSENVLNDLEKYTKALYAHGTKQAAKRGCQNGY